MAISLTLPTIQNWSCHNCGGCCRQHAIEVTEEERQRILSQGWAANDGTPTGDALFERHAGPPWAKHYRLAHQADGACVFLNEQGLCRIHAKFGEAAKPLACRIYPYAFHPAGKQVTVSLRFSCPSVVANRGRSMKQNADEIKQLARAVVPEGHERTPPPALSARERVDWPDLLRLRRSDSARSSSVPIADGAVRSQGHRCRLVGRLAWTLEVVPSCDEVRSRDGQRAAAAAGLSRRAVRVTRTAIRLSGRERRTLDAILPRQSSRSALLWPGVLRRAVGRGLSKSRIDFFGDDVDRTLAGGKSESDTVDSRRCLASIDHFRSSSRLLADLRLVRFPPPSPHVVADGRDSQIDSVVRTVGEDLR
ncbi:MAG: hypothetical protein FD138_2400 [Planctomycetota bacterium]|nr:MAG: hypothetical protein FD138_2400 [Planctomycetota bacterium]